MAQFENQSLYHPSLEHDSCGIGFIAHLKGEKRRSIVFDAIKMLENMEHRGGTGSDPETGDGAGVLTQIPHVLFKQECAKLGFQLPENEFYGVGMLFLPANKEVAEACKKSLEQDIEELGFTLLGYREVPHNNSAIGKVALSKKPQIIQVFVSHNVYRTGDNLERKLFVLRNYSTHNVARKVENHNGDYYFTTFSSRVISYKGQLATHQLMPFYTDLNDERYVSAIALIHSRFSTNTFPQWKLAQPFRFLAHNGEINTIVGNVNWMKSKETLFESTLFDRGDIKRLLPICNHTHSDSANLDNMVEMLFLGGRSLPHTMMMLIPEAWQGDDNMPADVKAFYEFHSTLSEAWDGPASVCFTDGKMVGATLDRNGLRPSRFCVTDDNILIMASEQGAHRVPQEKIILKGRLEPGKMFVADLEKGCIIENEEIKKQLASKKPYKEWVDTNLIQLNDLPAAPVKKGDYSEDTLISHQQSFGFTQDDLRFIITPMIKDGKEPIGSMGTDIPLAVLSNHSRHLSNYFKQLFAQVSNPPIDPIRENMVMSTRAYIGCIQNILAESPVHSRQIALPNVVLSNEDLEKLRHLSAIDFRSKTIDSVFIADGFPNRLEDAIDRICQEAEAAIINEHINVIIVSDRTIDGHHAPIPSLMAVGAIHHHLVKNGLRVRTSIIVEAGDVIETHHYATLIGYGATAVNPYLTIETIKAVLKEELVPADIDFNKAFYHYKKAIDAGLLKIFSKMGISTLQSYQGAQIFEAIGINQAVISKCFDGTISRLQGLGFDDIAKEILVRHVVGFPHTPLKYKRLPVGGIYQWKQRGEKHTLRPETIELLQQSTQNGDYSLFKSYENTIDIQDDGYLNLRGLFEFKKHTPIPLEEVESEELIVKRFATGAMSFGSISHEAHSTLAIAMNRLGAKSNSGEGGEDEIRFEKKPNGDWERSAIKQVASGRFGVTSHYLANADELQIKMAQGAKPGEGGQLPGHKVDEWIGRVRHSTPGVGLISPPPHHDIYSIEDLAQLIFDLKNANRQARISVKLVSKAGVGTIAAGVAKAYADVILISGYDGGTGASPISSVQHAGAPWELGLSEAHQTLVMNNLRSRVVLQCDGQLRTGRDLAIACLLGAEEWGISTAALIVEGCIMMRKCHLNTCPVGVATQDKSLRDKFTGDPEHVMNFFRFLVRSLREYMAELGFRTINEMVGQVDMLQQKANLDYWKVKNLDLSPILYKHPLSSEVGLFKQIEQEHKIADVLDLQFLSLAKPALEHQQKVYGEFEISNTDRTCGTILSHEISKKYAGIGLPEDTIHIKLKGSAGQSFGAFNAKGIKMELEGDANDYFGKGLSGGKLIVFPDKKARFKAEENILIGNVAFYGGTSGEAYIRGIAGERFCVRNSGVKVVVEGVGAHGCEYMTGGIVVNLGKVGLNFAAGMSGGIAYIYDPKNQFKKFVNKSYKDYGPIEFQDDALLKKMIEDHFTYTNSPVAENILANWDYEVNKFVKVMPNEYKEALKKYGKKEA